MEPTNKNELEGKLTAMSVGERYTFARALLIQRVGIGEWFLWEPGSDGPLKNRTARGMAKRAIRIRNLGRDYGP